MRRLFAHPPGFDSSLAARAMAAAGGARIHDVANLVETYWALCRLGQFAQAPEVEAQLREVLPMTHIYRGPGARAGLRCKIVARSLPIYTVQFADGVTGAANRAQLVRIPEGEGGRQRCDECGNGGFLSLVGGLCNGCRAEVIEALASSDPPLET